MYSISYSILRVSIISTETLRFPGKRCIISLRFLHYYNPYLHHVVWVGLRAVCTLKDTLGTNIIFVPCKMSSLDFFMTVLVSTRYLLKRARFLVDLFNK